MNKSPSQAFKIQTSTAVPTQNRGSEAPLRWGPRVSSLVSKYTPPKTKYTSSNTKYTLPYIKYSPQNTNYTLSNNKYTLQNTKYTFQNTKYTLPNTKYTFANTKYTLPNTKYTFPNTKYNFSLTFCHNEWKVPPPPRPPTFSIHFSQVKSHRLS